MSNTQKILSQDQITAFYHDLFVENQVEDLRRERVTELVEVQKGRINHRRFDRLNDRIYFKFISEMILLKSLNLRKLFSVILQS